MAKQKTTHNVHKKLITVIGYALYALLVVGFIFSFIVPWVNTVTNAPHANQPNLIIFMVALTAGALLPMLFAYVAGDKSTRTQNKQLHHFNGVLFGVLAYWAVSTPILYSLQSTLSDALVGPNAFPGAAVVINSTTVVAAALVTGLVGYFYHFYHTKRDGLLVYRPYQITLLALVWGGFVWSLFATSFEWILGSILPLVVAIVVFITVYAAARHAVANKLERATLATVWVSLVFIAMYVASGLYSITYMY